ncbi:hypothetical protein K438DRAFT_1867138 [Mycena galopus ATCC 62051]|nr:hypothetical protein K438DRAFT_1867138 [Mycena galopus ATCC 62051]
MRFSSIFAVVATSVIVSAQEPTVVPVQVGFNGTAAVPVFSPNNINATVGTIVSFQFTGAPGNHTVTQSTFLAPCTPAAGGFDSGWVDVPSSPALPSTPTWNLTITNASAPIWFYCKQLNPSGTKPHCNLGMVGVINISASNKSLSDFVAAAAAVSAVGQGEGGLVGIGASATAAPFIPSGAALVTGAAASATAPAASSSASGTPPPSGALANSASPVVVLAAALFGMAML